MARNSIIRAVITGDTRGLDRALGQSQSALGRFGRQATLAFAGVTAGIGAAVVAAKPLIDAASDLNEAASKSQEIFKGATDQVQAFADESARSFGISQTAALEAASNFGQFGNAAGLAGADLASFSTDLVAAAADVASFNNLSTDEALTKLQAGLAGQAEPLRDIGVFMNAAQVEAKALEMGLGDLNGELSEGEKVLARNALIMEQLGERGALGDFARTSDGLANQQRILSARFADVQAELGQKLLPVAIAAAGIALDLVDAFEKVITVFEEEGLAGVIDRLRDKFAWFDTLAGIIGDAVELATAFWARFGDDIIDTAQEIWTGVQERVSGLISVLTGLTDLIAGVWTGDWGRAWDGIKAIFEGVWESIKGTMRIARAALELTIEILLAAVKKLWDWSFLSDVITGVWDWIVEKAVGFGQALIDAIVNGITAAPNAIADALTSVIPDWVPGFGGGDRPNLADVAPGAGVAGVGSGLGDPGGTFFGEVNLYMDGVQVGEGVAEAQRRAGGVER